MLALDQINANRAGSVASPNSRSRREPMRVSQIRKGAAFLHHRNRDDFWHNLNVEIADFSLMKRAVSKMKFFGTAFLHQALEGAITGPIDVLIPSQGRHRMM